MSLIVSIIFFILTEEPAPKVLGYVCIPISLTLYPPYLLLIANSAPIKGLLETKVIFFRRDFLMSRDPVEISLNLV